MARDGKESLRLVVDLIPDSEPIAGRVLDAAGAVHEFCGWIEFAQAVDLVRQPRADAG